MTKDTGNNTTRLRENTEVWMKKYEQAYVAIKQVGIAEGKKIKITSSLKLLRRILRFSFGAFALLKAVQSPFSFKACDI